MLDGAHSKDSSLSWTLISLVMLSGARDSPLWVTTPNSEFWRSQKHSLRTNFTSPRAQFCLTLQQRYCICGKSEGLSRTQRSSRSQERHWNRNITKFCKTSAESHVPVYGSSTRCCTHQKCWWNGFKYIDRGRFYLTLYSVSVIFVDSHTYRNMQPQTLISDILQTTSCEQLTAKQTKYYFTPLLYTSHKG